MKRRQLLQGLAWAAGMGAISSLAPINPARAQTSFNGKLLLTLQLDGGFDVTSGCDPKTNQPGEREINTWARSAEIQTAGNIPYAPFANNSLLYDNHFEKMLVINGVDSQTNAHSVGILHNWSGRNSDGFPSLPALYSAINAPTLPLSYISFGGYGSTQGLIRSSRINDIGQIRNILYPNSLEYDTSVNHLLKSDFDRVTALRLQRAKQLAEAANLTAGQRNNRKVFLEALEQAPSLDAFAAVVPDESQLQAERELAENWTSNLHQQIQISLIAMKAGVTCASDLHAWGYDTHSDHDKEHIALTTNHNDAINYLWNYAEELGLADRIVLLIGTDFGRTPHYNSGAGKDHWPIGSYIVMEKNAGYTNRVFGETDGGHNTYKINAQTGKQDTVNGISIHPKHVHLALRKYLSIHGHELTNRYPFNNTEDLALFG